MNKDLENVKQAKRSFDRILDNDKYAGIIRDDRHLSLLISLIADRQYSKILDIGTGLATWLFRYLKNFPQQMFMG